MYETVDGKGAIRGLVFGHSGWHHSGRIETRIDRLALGNFGNCEPQERVSLSLNGLRAGYRVYFGLAMVLRSNTADGGKKDTQDADMKLARQYCG